MPGPEGPKELRLRTNETARMRAALSPEAGASTPNGLPHEAGAEALPLGGGRYCRDLR